MKLRNKKTGEVEKCEGITVQTDVRIYDYSSLAKANEEWEDYKPAEPLIKNRNVRDAIRAWAKSNLVERVKFEYVKGTGSVFAYSDFGAKIIFYGDLRLTNRTTYEIDDLCGEEEE